MGGWSFSHRVFLEEGYPETAALGARGSDEETAREATGPTHVPAHLPFTTHLNTHSSHSRMTTSVQPL